VEYYYSSVEEEEGPSLKRTSSSFCMVERPGRKGDCANKSVDGLHLISGATLDEDQDLVMRFSWNLTPPSSPYRPTIRLTAVPTQKAEPSMSFATWSRQQSKPPRGKGFFGI